jgi:glycyl-tRNA synthetase (class II)
MVNLSVFVLYNVKMKQHRRFVPHVISPVLGMVVIGYVCMNMNIHALTLGVIWSVIGLAVRGIGKRISRHPQSI